MIKAIAKYYLKFPPLARTAIDLSLKGFLSYTGVDFFEPAPEHILLGCDEIMTKKIFV